MRRAYAVTIARNANVDDREIFEAFARTPREDFLGPPPWLVGGGGLFPKRTSDVAELYCDGLVALDNARGINNGQPSLWAAVFDALDVKRGEHVAHLGAGGGYYTAILAKLVGADGKVEAYEIDPRLAEQARKALARWPQVSVRQESGATAKLAPADIIVASAGATHPAPNWLTALKPGGRLCFPLTARAGQGAMLLVTKRDAHNFDARFLFGVAFMDFAGLREAETEERLEQAFRRYAMSEVKSLRLGPPDENALANLWLEGDGWSLSRRPL